MEETRVLYRPSTNQLYDYSDQLMARAGQWDLICYESMDAFHNRNNQQKEVDSTYGTRLS